MAEALKSTMGGFLRFIPAGGWLIRKYLLGDGLNGSPGFDPDFGAPKTHVFYHFKTALLKGIALDRGNKKGNCSVHPSVFPSR